MIIWQTQAHSKINVSLLRWNLFRFTKQRQLSHEAFGPQNVATPSGGSTSLEWCPSMLAPHLPSMILAADPCPVMFTDQPTLLTLPDCVLQHSVCVCVFCYLWSCDNFHVVHQPSERGWHLVDDAMEQKLLCTMKHESSAHYQNGAVHLSFGFIRRCQTKVRMKETAFSRKWNYYVTWSHIVLFCTLFSLTTAVNAV